MEDNIYFINAKKNLTIRLLMFIAAFVFIIIKGLISKTPAQPLPLTIFIPINVFAIALLIGAYVYFKRNELPHRDGSKLDRLKNFLAYSGYYYISFEAIALLAGAFYLVTSNKIALAEAILFFILDIINNIRRNKIIDGIRTS